MSSAAEWRQARETGVELNFPSGLTARIRPIEIDFFLQTGTIPDIIAPYVTKLIKGEKTGAEERAIPTFEDIQKSAEWLRFLNQLAVFAFVDPVVSSDPQEGQISVWDVSYTDKAFLYTFFGRPVSFLKYFRDWQLGKVEPVSALAAAAGDGPTRQPDAAPEPLGQPNHGNARHVDRLPVR